MILTEIRKSIEVTSLQKQHLKMSGVKALNSTSAKTWITAVSASILPRNLVTSLNEEQTE